jgi:hypothetical protein
MKPSEVAAVYASTRDSAVRVLRSRGIGEDAAEDAVQDAAKYFIERAKTYKRLTPSLFIQKSILLALDGVVRPVHRYEVPVGTQTDLEELFPAGAEPIAVATSRRTSRAGAEHNREECRRRYHRNKQRAAAPDV